MTTRRDLLNVGVLVGVGGLLLATVAYSTRLSHPNITVGERERCYGISKAGQNDCGSNLHSCAGQSVRDHDLEEWVMVPTGTCTKIAGGMLDSPVRATVSAKP